MAKAAKGFFNFAEVSPEYGKIRGDTWTGPLQVGNNGESEAIRLPIGFSNFPAKGPADEKECLFFGGVGAGLFGK